MKTQPKTNKHFFKLCFDCLGTHLSLLLGVTEGSCHSHFQRPAHSRCSKLFAERDEGRKEDEKKEGRFLVWEFSHQECMTMSAPSSSLAFLETLKPGLGWEECPLQGDRCRNGHFLKFSQKYKLLSRQSWNSHQSNLFKKPINDSDAIRRLDPVCI